MRFLFIILLALISACSADGTVLFQDNFENVKAVTWPNLAVSANPVAQVGTWGYLLKNSTTDIQVCNNTVPGSAAQGANYLVLNRTTYASAWGDFSSVTTGPFVGISFDVYVLGLSDPSAGYNNGCDFFLRNSTDSNPNTNIVIEDSFHANGSVTHRGASLSTTSLGSFSTNTWVHVRYIIDMTARKYSLTVNNQTYTGLDFQASISQIRQLVIYAMSNQTRMYIDNMFCSSYSELRSDYISTGDNQVALWLPMDSNRAITTAFDTAAKDWNVDRILWRGAQDELWSQITKVSDQNRYYKTIWDWTFYCINVAGTNRSAIAAARKNGMSIWAIEGLFEYGSPPDTGGCGEYPYSTEKYVAIAHPEWLPINKYGTRLQSGPIEFAYPQARSYTVQALTNFLVSAGYDGFAFYTYTENYGLRYFDEFGYNQPIVDAFKSRYGVDIRTQTFDANAWARLRGEYVTQFLSELHAAFAPYGKKISVWLNCDDPNLPMYWTGSTTRTAGHVYMDWRTWVDEGIVDELMVYWPGNDTVLNQINQYCQGKNVKVSTMVTYGSLPTGVVRVLGSGEEVESGYGYDNMVGYNGENTPLVPLSSLSGTDVYAKRQALYLIASGKLSATVSNIIPVMNDPDVYVRRAALRALTYLNDSSAVPYIEAALTDPENSVRWQAAVCLGQLRGPNSVQKIIDAVGSNGTFQFDFVAVAQCLQDMQAANKITVADVNVLMSALGSSDPNVRRTVLRDLPNITCGNYPQLKPVLVGILQNDPDPFARELAVLALSYFANDTTVLIALHAAFNDTDEVLQNRVADYQNLSDLVNRFNHYGDFCTRSDCNWGWRNIGNAIVAYGQSGTNALQQLINQKNDTTLADVAWRSLYIGQQVSAFSFVTEQADASDQMQRSLFQNNLPITVFSDNFENVQGVARFPDVNSVADPVASVGSWVQIQKHNNYDMQVSSAPVPGASERGQYCAVRPIGPGDFLRGNIVPNANTAYPIVIIRFDFQIASAGGGNMEVKIRNSSDLNSDKLVVDLLFGADGTLMSHVGNNWINTGLTFTLDNWHRAICVIHLSEQTFDMYLSDKESTGLSLNSTQNWAGQIVFGTTASQSQLYLDNISINTTATCTQWLPGDLNGDCKVDFKDFALFCQSWLN
jgi:HEAT repeat protein